MDGTHFSRKPLHGHEVIVLVSRILLESVRLPDLVARWGGEEFLLALPDTPQAAAIAVAERIRQKLAAGQLTVGNLDLVVTTTFGVAQRQRGESLDRCLERADQALYQGKNQGKNRVVPAPPLKLDEGEKQLA